MWGGWGLLFFDPGELLSDSRDSLQWQQEAKLQKTEGSRMFLCPNKCYTCAQGKNQQRKKQCDEWSVENSSSEPQREGGTGGDSPRSLWHLGSRSRETGLWGDTTSTRSANFVGSAFNVQPKVAYILPPLPATHLQTTHPLWPGFLQEPPNCSSLNPCILIIYCL